VRLLVDECLSHTYVRRLADRGYPDAIHPIHVGMRRSRDDQILARAMSDDRVIISSNAKHYRRLLAASNLHPGAMLVEQTDLETTWAQILLALDHIEQQPSPDDYMVNRVVEVSDADGVRAYELPRAAEHPPLIAEARPNAATTRQQAARVMRETACDAQASLAGMRPMLWSPPARR
jgi:predicted nuclease of predicted toxin-antitoxin system